MLAVIARVQADCVQHDSCETRRECCWARTDVTGRKGGNGGEERGAKRCTLQCTALVRGCSLGVACARACAARSLLGTHMKTLNCRSASQLRTKLTAMSGRSHEPQTLSSFLPPQLSLSPGLAQVLQSIQRVCKLTNLAYELLVNDAPHQRRVQCAHLGLVLMDGAFNVSFYSYRTE